MNAMSVCLVLVSSFYLQRQISVFDDREAEIVKAIEALNGMVDYEDEARSKKVIQVDFLKRESTVKDQDLIILKELVDLQSLFINKNNITGKGFSELNPFDKLFQLELARSGVNDEAMKWVAKNKNLRNLGLAHTKVTDKGLEYLSQLKNIEFIDLSNTRITESGLIHFKNMKNLRFIVLPEIKGDMGGLKTLKEALPNLKIK